MTYSVNPAVDIVDATTGLASDLVSATLTGSNLHLTYKAHAAGVLSSDPGDLILRRQDPIEDLQAIAQTDLDHFGFG